jgi:hypothetical protein
MHPFILEQLAAEHVKDQFAAADYARRARQARSARRSRVSRPRTRLSLPGTQAGFVRRSATTAAAAVPAADRADPWAGHQGDELSLARREHTRA